MTKSPAPASPSNSGLHWAGLLADCSHSSSMPSGYPLSAIDGLPYSPKLELLNPRLRPLKCGSAAGRCPPGAVGAPLVVWGWKRGWLVAVRR